MQSIALGGLAVLLLASQAVGQPSKAHDQSDAAAYTPAPARPSPTQNLTADEPQVYKPSCNQPKNHDDASFCIERRAALAAERANVLAAEGNRGASKIFWPTIIGIAVSAAGTVFAGWAALAAGRAAIAAERAIEADIRPLLVVKVEHCWKEGQFVDEMFKVHNAGRGPAIIREVTRVWSYQKRGSLPVPIRRGKPARKDVKEFFLPVGAGGFSSEISLARTLTEAPGDNYTYFQCGIKFEDVDGKKYEAGYLFLISPKTPERGLHMAQPGKTVNEHNYQHAL